MPSLSETDRELLLELARQAIAEAVSHEKRNIAILPGAFTEKQGVFVTLQIRGRLRGCIGVVEAYEPLRDALPRCAVSAALQDPRFSPVRPEELAELQIEISLLSAPAPIRPGDVEIGKHGLLVSRDTHRGLLLPQVAVEHDLGREQFLAETCHKAGLAPGAWKEPETQIFAFTCEVFSQPKSEQT